MPKEENNTNKQPTKPSNNEELLSAAHSNIELDSIDKEPEQTQETPETVKDGQKKTKEDRGLSAKSALLHTYREDVESLVKKRKISMVRALAMQSDKKTQVGGNLNVGNSERASGFLIFSSMLMFLLGTSAIYIAYSTYNNNPSSDTSNNYPAINDAPLFVEYRVKLDITNQSAKSILTNMRNTLELSNTTLGSITQIQALDSGRVITQQELVKRLDLSLPEHFVRLMGDGNDYMVGIHVSDIDAPFILFTTRDYEEAFAAMLDWEMAAERELSPFFDSLDAPIFKRKTDNIIIQNINTRVLRDDNGEIRLLYSFLNEKVLLITNNLSTLKEVAQRYKVRQSPSAAL